MPTSPPFCINCKNCTLRPHLAGMAGAKPLASDYICGAIFHPVTGEQLSWSCQNARGDQMECGRSGKYFEPKSDADG